MGMILHCGASEVNREQLAEVKTPEPTRTWVPMAHIRLLDATERFLKHSGFEVNAEQHAITKDGARYFGLLQVTRIGDDNGPGDYSLCVAPRNSHDQHFRIGLAFGSSVFVCDNLAFSGEITVGRRHTRWAERDLPGLIAAACEQLAGLKESQDRRIETYKTAELTDARVHDLVVRSIDARVIPVTKVTKVLKEWREPRHPEFKERTAWSLFNSFTEVMKGTNIAELPRRTQRLHGLIDAEFSIAT